MILGLLLTIPFWLILGIIQPDYQFEIIRVYRLIAFSCMSICLALVTTKLILTYKNILRKQLADGETEINFEKDFQRMYVGLYIFCLSV